MWVRSSAPLRPRSSASKLAPSFGDSLYRSALGACPEPVEGLGSRKNRTPRKLSLQALALNRFLRCGMRGKLIQSSRSLGGAQWLRSLRKASLHRGTTVCPDLLGRNTRERAQGEGR